MPTSPTSAAHRRVQAIQAELATLGPLRPGSLSQQYNVCGNPTCRCKADPPQKHGPYYQLSYTWRGRSHTEFVRRDDLAAVKEQLRNYERLRTLIDEWIDSGIELVRLERQKRRSPQPKGTPKSRISAKSRVAAR
jgi:hypothetical protein